VNPATPSPAVPSRGRLIAGRILTALIGLFLIGASAIPKFIAWPGKDEMMTHLGLPLPLVPLIGVIELAVTAVYLIPRTAVLGAVLLTGYLGGAVLTHLRVGDHWCFPLLIGVGAWAGLALRRPAVGRFLFGGPGAVASCERTEVRAPRDSQFDGTGARP
jgi:uncharacterized membrane protein YphA (DoxX/SURF4 family)